MNSLLQQLSLLQSSAPSSAGKGGGGSGGSNAPGADSSTLLSGLLGSNKKTMDKISELKKENLELKSLEKLRPQLLDLQQQLVTLQGKYSDQQQFYQQEVEMLTDDNQQLSHGITSLKHSLDEKMSELNQNIIMIQQLTERNKYLESESRQLLIDLDDAKYEIEQVRLGSVDPVAMDELQKKIEQLEGKQTSISLPLPSFLAPPLPDHASLPSPLCCAVENKHLQRQKLTLSKDLNRLNTQSDSLVQLREENLILKSRVEELEAEKEAFKSVMEQLVESQPTEQKSNARMKLGKLLKLKK
jgi:hypothetical protein